MSLEELILACAEGGDAAWEEFVRRFHGLIAGVVLRTVQRWGTDSPALADDLIQETYLKICADRKRILAEFSPLHPEAFYGYLKVITANVVHDHFRSDRSRKRGQGKIEPLPNELDIVGAASAPAEADRDLFLREVNDFLNSALSGIDQKRDRSIFWLYYRFGLTATAIAALPSISLTVKGVESVILRLTRLVREQLAERSGTLS